MSKFAGLKSVRPSAPAASSPLSETLVGEQAPEQPARRSREGKRMVGAHFSPELSRALNILAIEQNTSVQGLMGEAFDLLFRQYGKHPFGER